MEAGDEDNLTNGGRAHLPACDGECGAHWNHEVPFAAVEDGRSHRNANHQTWGSERRRVAVRIIFTRVVLEEVNVAELRGRCPISRQEYEI